MSFQPPITARQLESGDIRRVVVSLGSNLPNGKRLPGELLQDAFSHLERAFDAPLQMSSFWETDPECCPPGTPPFINAIVTGWLPCSLGPEQVLESLHAIEAAFGRVRDATVNAPRLLDLDLVCLGGLICQGPGLRLPHPRAHLRGFVLRPLAELCPELVLPGQAHTVLELVDNLPVSGDKKIPHRP